MSTTTTEYMHLEFTIETSAVDPESKVGRIYDVTMRSVPLSSPATFYMYSAKGLTFGEVGEILAAAHHSRTSRGIIIPYVKMASAPFPE